MVKIIMHRGGMVHFRNVDYIRGEVSELGDLDSNYISVTHMWTFLKTTINYADVVELWHKFERDHS